MSLWTEDYRRGHEAGRVGEIKRAEKAEARVAELEQKLDQLAMEAGPQSLAAAWEQANNWRETATASAARVAEMVRVLLAIIERAEHRGADKVTDLGETLGQPIRYALVDALKAAGVELPPLTGDWADR